MRQLPPPPWHMIIRMAFKKKNASFHARACTVGSRTVPTGEIINFVRARQKFKKVHILSHLRFQTTSGVSGYFILFTLFKNHGYKELQRHGEQQRRSFENNTKEFFEQKDVILVTSKRKRGYMRCKGVLEL